MGYVNVVALWHNPDGEKRFRELLVEAGLHPYVLTVVDDDELGTATAVLAENELELDAIEKDHVFIEQAAVYNYARLRRNERMRRDNENISDSE